MIRINEKIVILMKIGFLNLNFNYVFIGSLIFLGIV